MSVPYARTYSDHWEKPEWIYDQVLKVEKRIDQPDMVALKEKSAALFQQRMAQEFPQFFQHYTKIFFRCINKTLTKQLFLMLLKQRQAMDNGTVSWDEGNHEVIGASFNLMLSGIADAELRDKIAHTYADLVTEEREEIRAAVQAKLDELNAAKGTGGTVHRDERNASDVMREVEKLTETFQRAPQQKKQLPME